LVYHSACTHKGSGHDGERSFGELHMMMKVQGKATTLVL
jgi:hypothetical protein